MLSEPVYEASVICCEILVVWKWDPFGWRYNGCHHLFPPNRGLQPLLVKGCRRLHRRGASRPRNFVTKVKKGKGQNNLPVQRERSIPLGKQCRIIERA